MKSLSSKSLFRALTDVYAFGLVIVILLVGKELPDLLIYGALLTALFVGAGSLIMQREAAMSVKERRVRVTAGVGWQVALGIYLCFILLTWIWSGFDAGGLR